jgi:hypothetical protein
MSYSKRFHVTASIYICMSPLQDVRFPLSRNSEIASTASPNYLTLANDLGKRSKWVLQEHIYRDLRTAGHSLNLKDRSCLLEHFLKR